MKRKTAQYPLSLVLIIVSSMLLVSLFILVTVGVLAGLFVEMLKFNSRAVYRNLKPTKYKISKAIVESKPNEKTTKVFKLPLPENARGKGVVMSPMNEKQLSKVR